MVHFSINYFRQKELKLGVTLAGNSLPVVPSWRIKSHSARSECTVGHRRLCQRRAAPPRAARSAPRWRGRCAPEGACSEPDRRLALRAPRWAPRALRALCAGQTGQPLAAIAASRYALGADGMGALRARAPAAARSRPRAARSAPMAWALRARAPTCAPPRERARCLSWWWGCRCRRLRALRAARDARCNAGFALLPRARVGRGGPEIIMHERAGGRLRATAACAA